MEVSISGAFIYCYDLYEIDECSSRVNGDLVLHSHEVMYRNAVASPSSTTSQNADEIDQLTSAAVAAVTPVADSAADVDDGPTATAESSDVDEGLLGQVADGLLGDVTQLGGIVKRVITRDIGPVQTRPRIGLVKLFRQPEASVVPPLNHTVTPPSSAAQALPSTAPANSTAFISRPDQIWVTPVNAAHKYYPSLGSYAAKTNTRPTTFMGMMFGKRNGSASIALDLS